MAGTRGKPGNGDKDTLKRPSELEAQAEAVDKMLVEMDRILARNECLTQKPNDEHLVRDPQLYVKWTPLHPHPMPVGYELFANERELRRVSILHPDQRMLVAAAGGNAWVAEELFAQGCPVNTKHGTGYTPLHIAATNRDVGMVKALLNMRADVNAANSFGATPLHCAVAAGGENGPCAHLIRDAGGAKELDAFQPVHIRLPSGALDVRVRDPPERALDDAARNLGRSAYTGQF